LFIDRVVEAPEFEVLFPSRYKSDSTDWPADVFDILDAFFADVDEYCADSRCEPASAGSTLTSFEQERSRQRHL
jgi:hypothetical protein